LREQSRRSAVESRNAYVNKQLIKIEERANLDAHLIFHVDRHLIAFEMHQKGLSSGQIKEVLGHVSLRTQEVYLGTLPEDHEREMMEGLL
jgi:site-specific recombinase XerD